MTLLESISGIILGVMSETISWTNLGAILEQFWEKFQNDFSDNTVTFEQTICKEFTLL